MADTFDHAVERMLGKDPHFKKEAYYFLNEALSKAMQEANTQDKLPKPGHVNASTLSLAFKDLVLERYGGLSKHVLKHWGILSSEDIGVLVYKLVEDGIWSKTEEDSIQDFTNLIDFDAVFLRPFISTQERTHALDLKPQAVQEEGLPSRQKKIAKAKSAENASPHLSKDKKTKTSAAPAKKNPRPLKASTVVKKTKAAEGKQPTKRASPKRKNPKN